MAVLPSGYIICDGVEKSYDSGVLSASDLEINGLFRNVSNVLSQNCWFFGARNTNSTSSAGQLNFVVTTSTNYFGCAGGRVTVSNFGLSDAFWHIYVRGNYFEFTDVNQVWSATGSATTFTGTQTMYINAINNAGSLGGASHPDLVCGFIIKKNGTLVKNFIPCYSESLSMQGLYEAVGGTFVQPLAGSTSSGITQRRIRVSSGTGGKGYLRTIRGERVEDMFVSPVYNTDFISQPNRCRVECIAEAEEGYVFKNWTVNGTIVSTDANYTFFTLTDTDIVANFQKSVEVMGLPYRLKVFNHYGDTYEFQVISASVTDDSLQKTTSTVIVNDYPSGNLVSMRAILRSPRGEILFQGIVSSVEGNTISLREMMSVFDREYIFSTSSFNKTNYTVRYGLTYLLMRATYSRRLSDSSVTDDLLYDNLGWIYQDTKNVADDLSLYEERNSTVTFPKITETNIQNMEDLCLSYSNFGIYMDFGSPDGISEGFIPRYYKTNDSITLGDNMENISNISVMVESQENTIVVVYNSTGATLRGLYGVMTDGSIGDYSSSLDDSQYIGYSNYIGKVVMSDDDINTILAENLSCSGLNHKITFNVFFNDLLPFGKLKKGTPVDFYVGNQLYKSVVTAVSFDILENKENIANAKVTLGNVRTSLTSKLNIKK